MQNDDMKINFKNWRKLEIKEDKFMKIIYLKIKKYIYQTTVKLII